MIDARVFLLAAGRGRRAGGPKAWRAWEGTTLLEAQLAFLVPLVGKGNVFVSIQREWETRCAALGSGARFTAANPDLPALASLQALLREAPKGRGFVLHVDMPVFDEAVWHALAAKDVDAAPVFDGRRGHPVLLAPDTLAAVSRLDGVRDRLDVFLRGRPVAEVSVGTEAVLANLNGAPA